MNKTLVGKAGLYISILSIFTSVMITILWVADVLTCNYIWTLVPIFIGLGIQISGVVAISLWCMDEEIVNEVAEEEKNSIGYNR